MRHAPAVLFIVALAGWGSAGAQTSPSPGFPDPVFDNPIQPPPRPYEPPIRPAPFVPPQAAPTFRPDFPGAQQQSPPIGPARPVLGQVCVVLATKTHPAVRCDRPRALVGTACRCPVGDTERAGRMRIR